MLCAYRFSQNVESAGSLNCSCPYEYVKFLCQLPQCHSLGRYKDIVAMSRILCCLCLVKAGSDKIQAFEAKIFHQPGNMAHINGVLRLDQSHCNYHMCIDVCKNCWWSYYNLLYSYQAP